MLVLINGSSQEGQVSSSSPDVNRECFILDGTLKVYILPLEKPLFEPLGKWKDQLENAQFLTEAIHLAIHVENPN